MDITVDDITISDLLPLRSPRPRDRMAEMKALAKIATTMAVGPSSTFKACVSAGMQLCEADSCGISLVERTDTGEAVFRWVAVTGQLSGFLNGTTRRDFSPCAVCVDSGAPLLMRRPEHYYTYLDLGIALHEVLLIPLTERGGSLEGTIWVVAHEHSREFDLEDARIMQRVASFTAAAAHVAKQAEDANAARHLPAIREPDGDTYRAG